MFSTTEAVADRGASEAVSRFGALSSIGIVVGILLSGPGALLVVQWIHPQPPWQDADVFVRHYHPIQTLPFFAGFILVSSFVFLIASLHRAAREEARVATMGALVFTAAFASLVFLNYAIQTTFVAAMAGHDAGAAAPVLTAFSMANPESLGWTLEMWGYAFLGVATWLVAPVFLDARGGGVERAASLAFRTNGPVSIATAVWTAVQPSWVLTPAGYVALGVWNLLVVAMGVLAWAAFRRRFRARLFTPVRGVSPRWE